MQYGISAYYYNYEDLQTVIIEVGKALVENELYNMAYPDPAVILFPER